MYGAPYISENVKTLVTKKNLVINSLKSVVVIKEVIIFLLFGKLYRLDFKNMLCIITT